jgi:hypothetical protein
MSGSTLGLPCMITTYTGPKRPCPPLHTSGCLTRLTGRRTWTAIGGAPRGWSRQNFWPSSGGHQGPGAGGGTVTSVLPVLALHTWPDQSGAEPGWTGWTYLSRRRLAALAGLDKNSVTAASRQLVTSNLMQMARRPRERHEGGTRRCTCWPRRSTRRGMNGMRGCRGICCTGGHGHCCRVPPGVTCTWSSPGSTSLGMKRVTSRASPKIWKATGSMRRRDAVPRPWLCSNRVSRSPDDQPGMPPTGASGTGP